jgi:hypothetical protein
MEQGEKTLGQFFTMGLVSMLGPLLRQDLTLICVDIAIAG